MVRDLSESRTTVNTESDAARPAALRFAYSDIFDERFPYYLAMGMNYDEYWRMDPWLVKAYRKASKLKAKQRDEEAWLHGLYIYRALCDVSPIFHPFAKPGTKPEPYPERPFTLEEAKKSEQPVTKTPNKSRAQQAFEIWAVGFNQRFAEKQREEAESDA